MKGLKDNEYDVFAHEVAKTITVNKSMAVVPGVAPLLSINTLYTVYFYSANALTGFVWIMIILIIPGGFTGTIEAVYNKDLHNWIRKIDKTTLYTGAVCTGVWVLGATGLLENKKASTNWYREEEFLKKYKAIPANQRYTKDGKYWTSAGVTAGMDMSLAIMKDIYGDNYAQAIMLDMEYDPHPPTKGGTPEKTDPVVNRLMKTMYDGGVNPLIDSLERQK